ncbi:type I-A CRISPR-associated protein Cas8a2/Csx9 [Pyrococcus yayanosii]|uniref:CRISPR-associated protein (Provisional), Csx9 family n=1 Tax=Pyrococcus yayanosii (strain CH1 / JCM 16557) TaxID=529709 RepID=F8AED3_PYRYC|nr:type I-A CRISPR-associated protein Cas8a2/Csx9 [Pyrococcus yayanosii]AEH24649.1 CRISPR-associated protein (provisional), Csx9 family [Pyrococcus yayanosii CH1]
MILEAIAKLPFEGLSRELMTLGLSWVVIDAGLSPNADDFADALENSMDTLEKRARMNSSRMSRNDRSSYNKLLSAWYGVKAPDTYTELFELAIREAVKLLRSGKLDPAKSLGSIKWDKNGTYLGQPYNGQYAISPAVVKQPEYYEFQSDFLKPTAGQKAQIYLDPLWLAILSTGFLTAFAGFIDGRYYLMTKPGIEAYFPDIEDILDSLLILTNAGIESRARLETEELYELKITMKLAEEKMNVLEEIYPVTLHLISLEGQVYTELKTLQLDLRELSNYLLAYVERIENYMAMGVNLKVKLKEDNIEVERYPLWALVNIAERELRKGIEGDRELLAYILVKDLYRAVNAGRKELIEDSVFRIFRQGRGLLEGTGKASGELRKVLRAFMQEHHLEVLV